MFLGLFLQLGTMLVVRTLCVEATPSEEHTPSLEDAVYQRVMARVQKEMAAGRLEIDSLKEELSQEKLALESAHQSIANLLSRDSAATNSTPVAFSVASINDFGPVSVDTNVPYTIEYVNIGGGWNSPINALQTPVDGVYYFAASMFAENGERGVCAIVHTDSSTGMQKAHMYATSSSSVGDSNHLVLQLAKGDFVSVQLMAGSYKIHSTPNSVYNTFSGFLLFAT